ncbi:NnrS family protein [Vibrio sp. SCSIO 43137]|uniref:NnrS family protein n=1 Tax=Vibrio sp. SCSIO 43137 TaxID=3021011 RepID=UPI00230804BF|nr:NnrS family protein [Vibrio sp. SCSIO 43137]WCE29352.1 NnrS family protein [Vibrio sp. SCSIO 43137]
MIKISDAKKKVSTDNSLPFLQFAFRPFFLLGAIFSILSLWVWNGALSGKLVVNLYGGILWWHMHEMLFGFAAAIIVGFLLTAVQNWSGIRGLNGRWLLGLVLVWLSARIAFFFPETLPAPLIAAIDLAFLPLAATALAYPIIKAKLWRNLLFIPILLVMALSNTATHYSVVENNYLIMNSASSFMVLLVTLVMCIMGGRVFPMFTANGTRTTRVDSIPLLEKLSFIAILAAVVAGSGVVPLAKPIIASLFAFAAIVHAVRAFRWKIWVTFKTPLVWSLHLSYWSIVAGLLMYALSEVTTLVSHSQAIHTLTVGAMATMILSMISRVSLGHTGRVIVVGKVMTAAFAAILISFLVRVFDLYFMDDYSLVLLLAVVFWTLAYGCFVVIYLPILIKSRVN